jgi:mRNA-degrading endonuclease HigB of HigAB toxin-antitoxin module
MENIEMQLIGKHRLDSIQGISDKIDLWIAAWITEVSHAAWKEPSAVLTAFPRVKSVNQIIFIFPVSGEEFPQIKLKIKFGMDKAMISEVIHE